MPVVRSVPGRLSLPLLLLLTPLLLLLLRTRCCCSGCCCCWERSQCCAALMLAPCTAGHAGVMMDGPGALLLRPLGLQLAPHFLPPLGELPPSQSSGA